MTQTNQISDHDLLELRSAQLSYLDSIQRLIVQVEKSVVPLLQKCETTDDIISARDDLRNSLGCSLDGIINVNFAIYFNARK